jgi:hypothetical protein
MGQAGIAPADSLGQSRGGAHGGGGDLGAMVPRHVGLDERAMRPTGGPWWIHGLPANGRSGSGLWAQPNNVTPLS